MGGPEKVARALFALKGRGGIVGRSRKSENVATTALKGSADQLEEVGAQKQIWPSRAEKKKFL